MTAPRRRLAPYVIYPATMAGAYGLFALLQSAGASLVVSTYTPILLAAAAVTALERLYPYRRDWQPPTGEVATDLGFMLVVQLAWPPLVSLGFMLALVAPARALDLPVQAWWPHAWPLWMQALLMVLAVDFLRYWLHRFSHENDTLWRLHAVHHSVEQLYWLNTGRFHPLEKTLQMSLDSVPFLLMGVAPEVLALYYLSYATNGFFQHCNIDLRYGVLNYVVGQRRDAPLAPRARTARLERQLRQHGDRVGSAVRHVVPAAGSADHGAGPAGTGLSQVVPAPADGALQAMSRAPSLLLKAAMATYGVRFWAPLDRAAARPADAQRAALLRILTANRDTTFGRTHGFAAVGSHADYARHVPVQQYEHLRPHVERQRTTGEPVLTAEAPVFYAQTSGSTGAPKYVPITPSVLTVTRTEQKIFSYLQYRACPAAFAGRTLGIMGAAVEGQLASGHAVGSVSGHLYRSMPRFVKARFVVPPDVSSVTDYALKYLLILRLALEVPDITYMGAPNPSSFLRLGALLQSHREPLLHSLATGSFAALDELSPEVRAALAGRITPHPARAEALDRLADLTFATVWPQLALVTTWTGGSCGIALDAVRRTLPESTQVMELGYQSTEFRGTLALAPEQPGGLPPLHHTFFEFIEEEAWDAGRAECLTVDQLEPKRRYQVIVTTTAGLYRYFMNDLVEVAGQHRHTPLLRFVQKGRGVTNLTGEKLYEAHVIEAVQATARAFGFGTSFFVMLASEATSAYRLYVEPDRGVVPPSAAVEAALDAALGERNLEYHGKRASGRLGAVSIAWLRPGAAEIYKAACVQAGQREGQYKPAVLLLERETKLPVAQLEALRSA